MLVPDDVLQNRYRIIAQLGKGGMGAVYRAWDMRLSIPVALKEMVAQPDLGVDVLDDLRGQFQQEAVTLARLNHPNLVGVTDYFQEGRNVYLVMKFVEGESLSERIKREGALPESTVLTWFSQLLDALAYCHSQGIIHRDIKPQNIIIGPGEAAVLVDFGLVKLWDPDDPRTRTAVRGIGTPQYAPPEQYELAAGHTEPRTDLYSLGATMYHALTGQAPPTATMRIAEPENYAAVRSLAPNVSAQVAAAIERAMELPRSKRWATAYEMANGLGINIRPWGQTGPVDARTEVISGRGGTVRMDTAHTEQMKKRRVPLWLMALLGALVVFGGGGAALWLGVGGLLRSGLAARDDATPTATSRPTQSPPPTATTATASAASPSATVAPTAAPGATPRPTRRPTATPSPTAPATRTPRPTRTPSATPSPTRDPTASPAAEATVGPTDTPRPTAGATSTASATATATQAAAAPTGALVDFEQFGTWRRGDQPNGELTQSSAQVRNGNYAAQLTYSFPASSQDFVVFSQTRALRGSPNTFRAWVYGDGSGHFLNLWVRDANGEVWSVGLGRVGGTGWQQLTGYLAPGLAWPNGHISGPDNGRVDYPVSFTAIVLDRPESGPLSGTIYIDEITAASGAVNSPTAQPTTAAGVPTPTQTPASQTPPGEVGRILLTVQADGGFLLYSTDPAWSQMREVGRIEYNASTCAPGAGRVTTLDGQSFGVVGISSCAVTERTDACMSPDGAYKLITNFLPGYEWAVLLQNVAAGTEQFYYQGKLNQNAGVRWDPTSSRVAFGVDQSILIITVGVEGYRQAVAGYDPAWPPQFSSDGQSMFYLKPSGGSGNSDVFLVNAADAVAADGPGERNLTNAPAARKLCPLWRR